MSTSLHSMKIKDSVFAFMATPAGVAFFKALFPDDNETSIRLRAVKYIEYVVGLGAQKNKWLDFSLKIGLEKDYYLNIKNNFKKYAETAKEYLKKEDLNDRAGIEDQTPPRPQPPTAAAENAAAANVPADVPSVMTPMMPVRREATAPSGGDGVTQLLTQNLIKCTTLIENQEGRVDRLEDLAGSTLNEVRKNKADQHQINSTQKEWNTETKAEIDVLKERITNIELTTEKKKQSHRRLHYPSSGK